MAKGATGNYLKLMALSIISLMLIIGQSTLTVHAAAVNQLPPGMVIGDDNGIHVDTDGQYLMEVNDVMPGKKWQTEVKMLNLEKDVPYALTMLIYPPEVSGPIDFSKAISMILTYEGAEVYNGPLSGVSDKVDLQKDVLDLGTLSPGDSKSLMVELEMDSSYTNNDFMVKSVMENIWEFHAIKTKEPAKPEPPVEPTKPEPPKKPTLLDLLPQTGEEWSRTLIGICLGLFFVMIVLLIMKKRRENNRS